MGGADDATENEEGVSLGEAVGKIAGGVAALWTSSFSMLGPLINREFRDRVFVATFLAITIQEFFNPHVAKMTMMVMATLFSAAVFAPKRKPFSDFLKSTEFTTDEHIIPFITAYFILLYLNRRAFLPHVSPSFHVRALLVFSVYLLNPFHYP